MIAFANLVLVKQPAIKQQSVVQALGQGFVLGIAAYATFALPLAWMLKDYPLVMAPIHIVGGGMFSMLTSGVTVFFYLRFSRGDGTSRL